MILTAIRLFQSGGYAATSWRKLVKESGAPWGSARHYFPDGKEQLGAEAIGAAARMIADRMDACFTNGATAHEAVQTLFSGTAAQFEKSGYCAGCPIATVALEQTPASEVMSKACAEALDLWRETIRAGLIRCGTKPDRAKTIVTPVLALFEGSLILARIARSTDPIHEAAAAAAQLLQGD